MFVSILVFSYSVVFSFLLYFSSMSLLFLYFPIVGYLHVKQEISMGNGMALNEILSLIPSGSCNGVIDREWI